MLEQKNDNKFTSDSVVKLSKIINTLLLVFVLSMLVFFGYFRIKIMIVYSIVAIAGYLFYYVLLNKKRLAEYLWCVYGTITIYMALATVSLGYTYGFQLYCMSLIPIIFYTKYMAKKLGTVDPHAEYIAIAIVFVYIISSCIAIVRGPVYTINRYVAAIVLFYNSLSVFAFLIYYTRLIVNLVIVSEEKLSSMANYDPMTGLYNRRYMLNHLENDLKTDDKEDWIAMLDVDDFKKINDTYGHNCGDYVLATIAEIMKDVCSDCVVSRWGGEEFLIHRYNSNNDISTLEKLRATVAGSQLKYNGCDIKLSVTIGVSKKTDGENIENWIKVADDRLYYGKNNGKNVVVDKEL